MTTQLHDTGEEFIMDVVFRSGTLTKPTNVNVGLFNDSTDALSDGSNVSDITTEPSGGAYARQLATLDGSDFTNTDSGGDWQTTIADQTFDTSDSNQDVDAYFITVSFAADDEGGTDQQHLFWTGQLDQTYDLNSVDSLTLSGAGLKVN